MGDVGHGANMDETMKRKIRQLVERLGENNIAAVFVENTKDAFDKVMSMIPEGSVVGFGDSLTL